MNCRRFSRIASRPCQSATPRLHVASSAKQSKPFPKVLSSISFQKASSHAGGAVFVMVRVVTCFSSRVRVVIVFLLSYQVSCACHPNMGRVKNGCNYVRGNKKGRQS